MHTLVLSQASFLLRGHFVFVVFNTKDHTVLYANELLAWESWLIQMFKELALRNKNLGTKMLFCR